MNVSNEILLAISTALAGATAAVVCLLNTGSTILYNSMRIDSQLLQTLVDTPNFESLYLEELYVRTGMFSSDYYFLVPYPVATDFSPIKVDPGMVVIDNKGNALSISKISSGFELPLNMLQLPTLLKINPTGYFILEATDYSDPNFTYYQITPYASDGSRIPTGGYPSRVFELDPCPPGKPY